MVPPQNIRLHWRVRTKHVEPKQRRVRIVTHLSTNIYLVEISRGYLPVSNAAQVEFKFVSVLGLESSQNCSAFGM